MNRAKIGWLLLAAVCGFIETTARIVREWAEQKVKTP